MRPEHPILIPSKGRAEKQLTSRTLDRLGLPHYIVVEEQDRKAYEANRYPTATLLTLDPEYKRTYETCDDLGDSKPKGSGPARNFIWDYAQHELGAPWAWTVDDNHDGAYRLNYNLKTPVVDGSIIRAMEAFAERYENMAMVGPNYYMFANRRQYRNPFVMNTRVYSFNLIRLDLPFRWRGRFNEDTILSLDMLKAGWCTALFTCFLVNKMTTQTMKGGNTDTIYADGTRAKTAMLTSVHPDVSREVWRWHRWHHYVDYGVFHQRLKRRDDVVIPEGTDNFGMVLERYDPTSADWVRVRTPYEGLPEPVEVAP